MLAIGLAACVTGRQSDPATTPVAFASDAPSAAVTEAVSASSAAVVDPSVDYHIGPMDKLTVTVFQVPDLNASVQVSESGQITLPLLGQVTAAGKTAAQLQADIAGQLGAKYLQSPQVTVAVQEMLSQQVTIEGAVTKPGVYPTNGKDDPAPDESPSRGPGRHCRRARASSSCETVGGQREAAKFDYSAIRGGGTSDPVLIAGDVVVVDTSGLKTAWQGVKSALPVFGFFRPLI